MAEVVSDDTQEIIPCLSRLLGGGRGQAECLLGKLARRDVECGAHHTGGSSSLVSAENFATAKEPDPIAILGGDTERHLVLREESLEAVVQGLLYSRQVV